MSKLSREVLLCVCRSFYELLLIINPLWKTHITQAYTRRTQSTDWDVDLIEKWRDSWSYSHCFSSPKLKDKVCRSLLITDRSSRSCLNFILCFVVKIFQVKCSHFPWSPTLITWSSVLRRIRSSALLLCVCVPSPTFPELRAFSHFLCHRRPMDF